MSARVQLADLIAAASQTTCWTREQIVGPSRSRPLVRVRQAIYMLAKDRVGMSYAETGRRIGNRNHSTVIYGADFARYLAGKDKAFSMMVAALNDNASQIADQRHAQMADAIARAGLPHHTTGVCND